jgi:hypothetical protein
MIEANIIEATKKGITITCTSTITTTIIILVTLGKSDLRNRYDFVRGHNAHNGSSRHKPFHRRSLHRQCQAWCQNSVRMLPVGCQHGVRMPLESYESDVTLKKKKKKVLQCQQTETLSWAQIDKQNR